MKDMYRTSIAILKHDEDAADAIQDTCFQIDTIEISPISVKLNYNVYGEAEVLEDETGVPDFGGLVLENGERILMAGSGAVGYTDETKAGAYCICAFNRVIDLDTVCGVLIRTMPGGELIEMEIR